MLLPLALPTDSLTAAVRAHLALSTRQLARYFGVTAGFVAHLETGYRGLPPALAPRLLQLSRLLPLPLGQEGTPVPPVPPPYDPLAPLPPAEPLLGEEGAVALAPLHRRQRDLQLLLFTHGRRLAHMQRRAAALAHRRWGLAQLRTAPAPPDSAEATRYARWLDELTADLLRDEPDPAANAAVRQLQAARVAGLRAELAALLAFTPAPTPA